MSDYAFQANVLDILSSSTKNTLFDKIIDITFNADINTLYNKPSGKGENADETMRILLDVLKEQGKYLQIKVPTTSLGIKPDIAIGFKTLPGQICYNCTVKIKNFKCNYNIRRFKSMDITAGYSHGPKITFHSPIFTSYRESPSPDGVTVFEGVIVGSVDSLFSNRAITIDIYPNNMTFRQFITECLTQSKSGKDTGLTADFSNCEDIMNEKVGVAHHYFSAANGYSLIMWIAEQVNQYSSARGYGNVITYIKDNKVIFAKAEPYKGQGVILERTMRILKLDKVTSAEFNGTTVVVKAPWHPYVQPLSLFYMEPNVYGGSSLPNVLNVEDYWKDPDNVYQVITEEVSFETNGSTNEMTLFAVPIKAPKELGNTGDMARAEALAQIEKEAVIEIKIGNKPSEETSQSEKDNWAAAPFPVMAITYYEVQEGDTLTSIADKLYAGVPAYSVTYEQLPRSWDTVNSQLGIEKPSPGKTKTPGVPHRYFWPVIAAATRQRMGKSSAEKNVRINVNNPDAIQPGWMLAVPNLTSLKGHEDLKELFGRMARAMKHWKKDRDNDEWKEIGKIYVYMGGTEVV